MFSAIQSVINLFSPEKSNIVNSEHELIDLLRNNQFLTERDLNKIIYNSPNISHENYLSFNRMNFDNLSNSHREVVQPNYLFNIEPSKHVFGEGQDFFNNIRITTESFGSRNVLLKNIECSPNWDLITWGGNAFFPQLTKHNGYLIQSYIQNNRLIGWTDKFFLVKKMRPTQIHEIDKGIVLFGSYMTQWGHLVIDLLFRTLSVDKYQEKYPFLLDEETPQNFVDLLSSIYPFAKILKFPADSQVRVENAVIPLSRTLCPVGWVPELDRSAGWGWNLDGPASRLIQNKFKNIEIHKREKGLRLYFKRSQKNRRIINNLAFEKYLEELNFKFIETEKVPILELIKIMNQAEIVVGVSASQMNNLIFANPGIKVILLKSKFQNRMGISGAIPYLGHKEFVIYCDTDESINTENLSSYEKQQLPLRLNSENYKKAIDFAINCG